MFSAFIRRASSRTKIKIQSVLISARRRDKIVYQVKLNFINYNITLKLANKRGTERPRATAFLHYLRQCVDH